MAATFTVRSAACEPCTPHLTALRSLATRRGDTEILREVEALQQRARAGAVSDDLREDRLRFQVKTVWRWLDAEAGAFLAREQDHFAALLDARLDAVSFLGRRARAAAGRELRALLRERLAPWRARLREQAVDVYAQTARRLGSDPAPAWSPETRVALTLALPAVFLDLGAVGRFVLDRFRPGAAVWHRVRRDVQGEGVVLLRANVTRLADDLKEQMEAALRGAASTMG